MAQLWAGLGAKLGLSWGLGYELSNYTARLPLSSILWFA